MKPSSLVVFLLVLAWAPAGARAATYYVALDGDPANDGSPAAPWPSLRHAFGQVQGGDTVIVGDGEYHGYVMCNRAFDDWVTVRAEHPHRAVLTHPFGDSEVVLLLGARKVILEDLVFTNVDPAYTCEQVENNWLVHFEQVQEVIFRNNIVFGNQAAGACNRLLAINRSTADFYPQDIQITGNLFYAAPDIGGSNLVYLNVMGEIDVTGNIFFAHQSPQAGSYIELYKEARPEDAGIQPRSPRFVFARNVFLNWGCLNNTGFIQLGQGWDQTNTVRDVLIENNLMIGNSPVEMNAPVQVRCGDRVTLRANTVVGDLPAGAYALHLFYEGIQVTKKDVFLRNNIFSDPTGTMGDRLIDYRTDVIDPQAVNLILDHNLYFNASSPLPDLQAPAPADDAHRLVADPLLEDDQSGLVLPIWDTASHSFPSGNTTIREEFERLVQAYGAIPRDSPAVGAADPAHMPEVDILGRVRDAGPDLGCFEYPNPRPDAGPGDDGEPAAADDGGIADGGDILPGRVVLRAGPPVPAGRVVAPGSGQVILRLELEAENARGRLTGLRLRLEGLEQADSPGARIQAGLYPDPEGDGIRDPAGQPVGGAWVREGLAALQVGGLPFSPGEPLALLVELSVVRTSAGRAGTTGPGLLVLLALGMGWFSRRSGFRMAVGLLLVVSLLACTRYGFKPTRFNARPVIESAADVAVDPEISVGLEPTPLVGQSFKLSL